MTHHNEPTPEPSDKPSATASEQTFVDANGRDHCPFCGSTAPICSHSRGALFAPEGGWPRIDARDERIASLLAENERLREEVSDCEREIGQLARGVSITKDADIFALKRELQSSNEYIDKLQKAAREYAAKVDALLPRIIADRQLASAHGIEWPRGDEFNWSVERHALEIILERAPGEVLEERKG